MDWKYGNLPERMEKLNLMEELNVQTPAARENAFKLVKLVSSAEFVADATKFLANTSTVFQLVAISA